MATWATIKKLELTWHNDMLWLGLAGIGSSYTIESYTKQHSVDNQVVNGVKRGHLRHFLINA